MKALSLRNDQLKASGWNKFMDLPRFDLQNIKL
jgi:hypothetical protein